MKKILLLISLTSLLISQQPKRGIGFEFHTLPSIMMEQMSAESGSSMGVYFPFETASGIFIEPLITYTSSSSERDYDNGYYGGNGYPNDHESSSVSWGISLGIFKSTYSNKMRTYFGVRAGKIWDVSEGTNIDTDEDELLIIAPTFGAEYFINESFSFGGEAMYTMLTDENDDNNSYTRTYKSSMLIPKFMVRFYY